MNSFSLKYSNTMNHFNNFACFYKSKKSGYTEQWNYETIMPKDIIIDLYYHCLATVKY